MSFLENASAYVSHVSQLSFVLILESEKQTQGTWEVRTLETNSSRKSRKRKNSWQNAKSSQDHISSTIL